MTQQPKSLQLADELAGNQLYGLTRQCRDEAAAELRRLQSENDSLWETLTKLAAYLEIDPKKARRAPGLPSDVFIAAIDRKALKAQEEVSENFSRLLKMT